MKRFVWGVLASVALTLVASLLVSFTFLPGFYLGFLGMPRRFHADPTAGEQSAPAQTGRTAQFENGSVRVWKTVVAPGTPTALHRHDHPRVVVALTDGTMAFVASDGKREEVKWKAGKAYWLPAMPPGAMHSDVNAGTKPLEVMVVELEKE